MTGATIGGRIQTAREAASLSPSQMAMRMGAKTNTIKNWESDRSEPRANQLSMLAGVLGVPILWLLSGKDFSDDSLDDKIDETVGITRKLERLLALHQTSSVLIMELQQEINRLQNQIDLGGMAVAESLPKK